MQNKNNSDRKVPCISFTIPLNLRFSIALRWKEYEDFKFIVKNNNEDITKVMTGFVFKRLGINDLNIREFEKYLFEDVEHAKKKIYNDLALKLGNSPSQKVFCKLMSEDIEKYVKKEEKHENI